MCHVPVPEVPAVELEFRVDDCACHARPREMVEVWRPGYRHQLSAVYLVSEVQRHRPGLWAAIRSRHAEWVASRTPVALIPYYAGASLGDTALDHSRRL